MPPRPPRTEPDWSAQSGESCARAASASSAALRPLEHVPDASNGLDPSRTAGVIAQLAAKRGNVHVDRTVEGFEIALRHFHQQVLARLHAIRGARQRQKQVELL